MNTLARADATAGGEPLAALRDLTISFDSAVGRPVTVVDHVSFDIHAGDVLGLVGESGSGKSLTARSILRLTPKGGRVSGSVCFKGQDMFALDALRLRELRGSAVAMVFQDPMTSFNPVLRVGDQIAEAMTLHGTAPRRSLKGRVASLLDRVGIQAPRERARSYPHEFSGGMRQRALMAMAVANGPELLIADEPTTALDVTVQDQIMDLMRDLNERFGAAILLITHNMSVVASMCTRIIVMYAGRIVEDGPTEAVLRDPQHPYTWMLLQSVPRLDGPRRRLTTIEGQPPDPAALPPGCKFAPRCRFTIARCRAEEPPLEPAGEGTRARCWVRMQNVPQAAR